MPGVPFVSANEKVRIAFIGIGNRGGEIAQELYKPVCAKWLHFVM